MSLASYHKIAPSIPGWFNTRFIKIIDCLGRLQREEGCEGDILEVGVYLGKSLIPLAMEGIENGDLCIGVDSCKLKPGAFDYVRKNLSTCGVSTDGVMLVNCDSSCIPESVMDGRRFRIVHIDGSHDAGVALSDMNLAASKMSEGGCIILDDVFNSRWPGVSEAFHRFMSSHPDHSCCFIGHNKAVVAERVVASKYIDAIRRATGFWRIARYYDADCLLVD